MSKLVLHITGLKNKWAELSERRFTKQIQKFTSQYMMTSCGEHFRKSKTKETPKSAAREPACRKGHIKLILLSLNG